MKIIKSISILSIFILLFSCNQNVNKNASEQKNVSAIDSSKCKDKHADAGFDKLISHSVKVIGEVENPLVLTVDSLLKMNVKHIDRYMSVCQTGATDSVNKTFEGVLLKDILEKAKLKQLNHKDRAFYIVANASDNYKAVFSWGEIFNNITGENVYVVFKENGEMIKEKGEMKLIITNDIKSGPRHVYWLTSIEVVKVK
ncbi:MAG: molybdopterin-dependent oxidoreductase [Bacteroidota bacterium]